jgi:hypothetical protein
MSAVSSQAKNEIDRLGLRKCIRPSLEHKLPTLMECALVLFSNPALEGLFPLTGFESAGFDRCVIS